MAGERGVLLIEELPGKYLQTENPPMLSGIHPAPAGKFLPRSVLKTARADLQREWQTPSQSARPEYSAQIRFVPTFWIKFMDMLLSVVTTQISDPVPCRQM